MRATAVNHLLLLVLLGSVHSDVYGFSLRDSIQHMHSISTAGAAGKSSSRLSSEVLQLPGLKGRLPSQHFAGYITVDNASQRQLFYYLVTRETSSDDSSGHTISQQQQQQQQQHRGASSPSRDDTPLIIWLTGGPGCSSLDAFTYENGPFVFSAPESEGREATLKDIRLTPNPFSWSKTAHIVYIDSPAGTGFSYTQGVDSYHTSDDKTIQDLEVFVAGLFQKHPWLQKQPLYIAGESYGGVYVPLLTRALLRHNQRVQQQASSSSSSSSGLSYNLAGYIVGNAVTDDFYDGSGQAEFAFGMGLIDPETYKMVKRTCKANGWHVNADSPCAKALETMEATMGPINQYDILGKCFNPAAPTAQAQSAPATATTPTTGHPAAASAGAEVGSLRAVDYWFLMAARKLQQQQEEQHAVPSGRHKGQQNSGGLLLESAVGEGRLRTAKQLRHAVSCADRRYASVYYNSPEVRAALHAADVQQLGRWEPCSDVLHYTHTVGSMIPVHRELLEGGLRGLVLSGDHDYVVPYTGTRAWVYDMDLKQSKPWHRWTLPGDDQVAGYAVEFRAGLTFATVKGGGHMVPQTHPQAALALLQQWMQGEL